MEITGTVPIGCGCTILNEAQLAEPLDIAIRETLCRCFPASRDVFSRQRSWHGSRPAWTVLIQRA
jgi:hypothetical protein